MSESLEAKLQRYKDLIKSIHTSAKPTRKPRPASLAPIARKHTNMGPPRRDEPLISISGFSLQLNSVRPKSSSSSSSGRIPKLVPLSGQRSVKQQLSTRSIVVVGDNPPSVENSATPSIHRASQMVPSIPVILSIDPEVIKARIADIQRQKNELEMTTRKSIISVSTPPSTPPEESTISAELCNFLLN